MRLTRTKDGVTLSAEQTRLTKGWLLQLSWSARGVRGWVLLSYVYSGNGEWRDAVVKRWVPRAPNAGG